MILNPAVIALVSGALVVSLFAIYASFIGIKIIRWWDIQSGSERQLMLEKQTYLTSTIFSSLLGFELFSLFLFVYTADHIHGLFVGAMCAAGSLNVNYFGYPTLVMKIITFILCGIWIVLNHADQRGFDYPLIKPKYKFMLCITAFLILETILQAKYFLKMRPDVITSCCGRLFGENPGSVVSQIAALPANGTQIFFFLSLILTIRVGVHFFLTGRGARVFAGLAAWSMIVSLASVVSFICLYFYEMPSHHCPFCLLQKEYSYIGYPLYLSLFFAGITGVSVGVVDHFKGSKTLQRLIPHLERKLCLVCMGAYAIFLMISTYPMIFSDFTLKG